MLKFTKVAFATLLSAFLLLAGAGCKYLDSATEGVEVSTQSGAPVAEPSGGVDYKPAPSKPDESGEGEEGGEGTPSSSITVTAKMVYNGSAFTSYSLSLSEIQSYASAGLKAYWNEGLTEEITNVNQLKNGDIIYINYSDYMQVVSLSGNI